MECRIHRSSPTAIDIDFHLNIPGTIITKQVSSHHDAVELKRRFDEAADEGEQAGIIEAECSILLADS